MKLFQCGFTLILAVAVLAKADTGLSEHSLKVRASTPTVEVSPRMAARNYVRLPTLEFTFQLTAHCRGNFGPRAVSLSIADSRRSLSADQLGEANAGSELTVKVPAKQLAPLAIENFCVRQPEGAGNVHSTEYPGTMMMVPAALSAQASLLCVDEEQEEIVYTSTPLDINLICKSAQSATE